MKMNNKKIIVSTLALAMGAALAGSVSGTVAWFQYSTRAQAAFIGTSAHCSEMLEIKSLGPTASAFAGDLDSTKVNNMDGYGTDLQPISSGALTADAAITPASFYRNPVYQITDSSNWGLATNANFVQLQFQLHVKDVNKGEAAYLGGHNLYLTNLSIVGLNAGGTAVDNNNDLYKALRVHVAAGEYHKTFAAGGTGGAETVTTATNGQLDLNGDGNLDTAARYEWDGAAGDPLTYGDGSQVVHNADKAGVLADDTDAKAIATNKGTAGLIGAIPANEAGITVTVTMWIEGWQQLSDGVGESTNASVWEPATYIGAKFGVGFRFATELHEAHA